MKLEELRGEIDRIDQELVLLLEKRIIRSGIIERYRIRKEKDAN